MYVPRTVQEYLGKVCMSNDQLDIATATSPAVTSPKCDKESPIQPSRSSVSTFSNTMNDFTLSNHPTVTDSIADI